MIGYYYILYSNIDLFGGAKKTTKSKKTKKTSETKKTTKSAKASDAKKPKKSKAKGGNFLGAIGDLVAPTGWGPFATAAGLLALDRADAALRRGTKEKNEKMKGGNCEALSASDSFVTTNNFYEHKNNNKLLYESNLKTNRDFFNNLGNPQIKIICQDGRYNLQLIGICRQNVFEYTNDASVFKMDNFDELKKIISIRENQLKFIRSCVKSKDLLKKCKNPNS